MPLTDLEKQHLNESKGFQTKDFDCVLTDIFLEDECIKISRWTYEEVPVEERPHPIAEGLLGLQGSMRKTNERMEEVSDFHGLVNFYTFIDEEWYEFNAKYTDGKLKEIVRVTEN